MLTWFQALVLGVVQGLTEFLPISSSAHILVISKLAGWQDPGAAFTAVTQIGTELAVVVYFRAEIWQVLRSIVGWFGSARYRGTSDARFAWAIVWGSLPIGGFGLLFKHQIETQVRSLTLVAAMLILFGVVLILVERFAHRRNRTTDLTIGVALQMGFAQALALIPGVSRSGATIAMGLAAGLERRAATRYAFLLAVPAVFASGLLEAFAIGAGPVAWGPTLFATAIAFVVGLGVIAGLLNFLRRHSFVGFGIYRIVLGSALLGAVAAGWLH